MKLLNKISPLAALSVMFMFMLALSAILCALAPSFLQGATRASNEKYAVILGKHNFDGPLASAHLLAHRNQAVRDGFSIHQNQDSNPDLNWWHRWGKKAATIIGWTGIGLMLGVVSGTNIFKNRSSKTGSLGSILAITTIVGGVSGFLMGCAMAF